MYSKNLLKILIQNLDLSPLKNSDICSRIHMRRCQSQNVLNWSYRNGRKKQTNKQTNKQIEETTYSSRSSFLLSHHQTLGRQSLHLTLWLERVKMCRLDKPTLVNSRVNFQSCARQRRSSQGPSFTDVYHTDLKLKS